jgi:hypothetical protein
MPRGNSRTCRCRPGRDSTLAGSGSGAHPSHVVTDSKHLRRDSLQVDDDSKRLRVLLESVASDSSSVDDRSKARRPHSSHRRRDLDHLGDAFERLDDAFDRFGDAFQPVDTAFDVLVAPSRRSGNDRHLLRPPSNLRADDCHRRRRASSLVRRHRDRCRIDRRRCGGDRSVVDAARFLRRPTKNLRRNHRDPRRIDRSSVEGARDPVDDASSSARRARSTERKLSHSVGSLFSISDSGTSTVRPDRTKVTPAAMRSRRRKCRDTPPTFASCSSE